MKRYGLIGKKLGHSFSKKYFEKKFDELRLEAAYDNFELATISEIKHILNQPISGLNVTVPYKVEIIPYLHELDESAKAIGAVNCVKLTEGYFKGYNTDAFGFEQMIKPFLESQHERALILGTGGASKAVEYVLKELGVQVYFVSRNPKRENDLGYNDINEIIFKSFKLVINTTPMGMFPDTDDCPELPYHLFTEGHLAVDLIYNPEVTLFMKKASEFGANTINGLTMLNQQAEKSWEIWNS